MPTSTDSEMMNRRDSWPPTQLRVTRPRRSKDEPRPLLEDINEDPLTYFLTPAPYAEDDDSEGDVMDFDAGIEDTGHPREIIRSVSPSSLDGISKTKPCPSSPECDSGATTSEDDDDEDYISFSPPPTRRPWQLGLRDLAVDSLRYRTRSPVFGRNANALLSPTRLAPVPHATPRGRAQARGRRTQSQTRSLSASARARSGRLWRQPSPDVWSIEEETEEELVSETGGSSVAGRSDVGDDGGRGRVDGASAKPKKKVRFVLPVKE